MALKGGGGAGGGLRRRCCYGSSHKLTCPSHRVYIPPSPRGLPASGRQLPIACCEEPYHDSCSSRQGSNTHSASSRPDLPRANQGPAVFPARLMYSRKSGSPAKHWQAARDWRPCRIQALSGHCVYYPVLAFTNLAIGLNNRAYIMPGRGLL